MLWAANANAQDNNQDSLLTIPKKFPQQTFYDALVSFEDDTLVVDKNAKLMEAQRQIFTRRDLISYQDLGTHFSPIRILDGIQSQSNGFNTGNQWVGYYQKSLKDLPFYNASMPLTSFKYAQGGKSYIQFDALHTQNIIKTWNFTAGIQSFTNQGFGLRQSSFHRAPFITSHFTLPNNRLRIVAGFSWLRRINQENGGLSSTDSLVNINDLSGIKKTALELFPVTSGLERNTLPVGLKNAYDTLKSSNHNVYFQYYLGKKYNDTLDSFRKILPLFAINVQLAFEKEQWLYADNFGDSVYYPRLSYARANNRDSQTLKKYTAIIGLGKLKSQINGIVFNTNIGFENYSYNHNNFIRFSGVNSFFQGNLTTILKENIMLKSNAVFYFSGYNLGDYDFNAFASFMKSDFKIIGFINSQLKMPAPVFASFNSPYFAHFNNFNQTLTNSIGGKVIIRKNKPYTLGIMLKNINNHLYFDEQYQARQFQSNIQFVKFSLSKHFNYRSLNLAFDGFIQSSSNMAVIPLPNWGFKADLFFQKMIFDSALHLKTGIDVFVNGKSNNMTYMPVLRQFALQNNGSIGNNPLLDFYISGEVKTVVFFFKLENITYNFMPNSDYTTPLFPNQPTAFRLGLLWDFFL